MKRFILIVNILFIVFLTLNCSARNYYYSDKITNIPIRSKPPEKLSHDDPNFPKEEYALLTSTNNVFIRELDDELVGGLGNLFEYIVILPGKHTVSVSLNSMNAKSYNDLEVEFTVKKNQTVVICASIFDKKWKPRAHILDGFLPKLLETKDYPYPCR
ncbi:hypothetical protein [Leptospira sp. GIMC2001]|uniref:hypothetical protein n=1 Tax=Leptospira sp. GIMC2001 TaxID=1513297 RepID=UPI002349308E|nr:hypothetical protein [Leptospira sp. GIMC2001]WCL51138.1 hypothetical protein O4O04_10090 [Leptospira sp. GIMC2001]